MRKTFFAALVAVALSFSAFGADAARGANPSTPADITKAFMRAVIDKDRNALGQLFDYEFVLDQINSMFESQGAGRPYDLPTIQDTLYYHFTADEQKKIMEELDRPNITFTEIIDDANGFAAVDITKPDVRDGDKYGQQIRIGLRNVNGQWKIQVFPLFYPLNASQLTTGA